jgi:hypothetical protein
VVLAHVHQRLVATERGGAGAHEPTQLRTGDRMVVSSQEHALSKPDLTISTNDDRCMSRTVDDDVRSRQQECRAWRVQAAMTSAP